MVIKANDIPSPNFLHGIKTDGAGGTIPSYLKCDSENQLITGSPTTILSGTIQATTSSGTIAPATPCQKIVVQANPNNANNMRVGNSSVQGLILTAGSSVEIEVDDIEKIYVIGVGGTANVGWTGS